MSTRSINNVVRAAIVIVLGFSSVYTLGETEQAVLTIFGKPAGDPVKTPGLHFKIPFVEAVNRFDKRWLEFDGDPNQIPTRDKKYLWIETYARWRISDPLRFYEAVQDERGAQSRLDDIVDGETRNAVASFDVIELVRTSNRAFEATEELTGVEEGADVVTKVITGRTKIAAVILEKAAAITPQFGVELEDVRFKRISYVESVQAKVYERMISERKRIAEKSRSEGAGRAAEIRGQKDRDLLAASSEGYKKAQLLKGAADARATSIFARAYERDADFYSFLKSLETLEKTIDAKSVLVLSTESELLKYLKGSK
ncbi:MAG: protease modulator HflC [Vicinamibacteria bacterium]